MQQVLNNDEYRMVESLVTLDQSQISGLRSLHYNNLDKKSFFLNQRDTHGLGTNAKTMADLNFLHLNCLIQLKYYAWFLVRWLMMCQFQSF